MTEIDILKFALNQFADISADDFELSTAFWQQKEYKKGEYYNQHKSVCKYLGFITTGVFVPTLLTTRQAKKKIRPNYLFRLRQ